MRSAFVLVIALTTSVLAAEPEVIPFGDAVLTGFAKWDADHDGSLTESEVCWGLANPEIKGPEAAALAALFRGIRNKSHPLVPPFTQTGLIELTATSDGVKDLDQDLEKPDLNGYYVSCLKRINETQRKLFVTGQPQLDSFRQGKVGSCFCLAPLAALIHRDPAEVASRFTATPTGYTVRFNDKRTVTVTEPTDGELSISSSTGSDGFWSTVYEKAVGQMRIEDKGVPGPPLVAAVSGSAGKMVSVLTGNSIKRFSCKPFLKSDITDEERSTKLAELRSLLTADSTNHRLMTLGTASRGNKVPSIASWHAYAILGYDQATDMITIRDPHGQDFTPKGAPGLKNGYLTQKGVFQAPLTEVVQFVGGFAFEQPEPASASNAAERETSGDERP